VIYRKESWARPCTAPRSDPPRQPVGAARAARLPRAGRRDRLGQTDPPTTWTSPPLAPTSRCRYRAFAPAASRLSNGGRSIWSCLPHIGDPVRRLIERDVVGLCSDASAVGNLAARQCAGRRPFAWQRDDVAGGGHGRRRSTTNLARPLTLANGRDGRAGRRHCLSRASCKQLDDRSPSTCRPMTAVGLDHK
jgi:hypothetical protein